MSPKSTAPKQTEATEQTTTEEKPTKAKTTGKIDLPKGGTVYFGDPDDDFEIVGLDTKDGQEHPLWDPRIHMVLTEPEIRNVEYHGIETPVKTRRSPNNNGKFQVMEGRQRIRKARIVKQRQLARGEKDTIKVPFLVEKVNDDAHLFEKSRVGNVSRGDGPMTTARNVQKYMSYPGRTVAMAADSFAVTEQTIRNYLAMLELDPAVVDAMVKEEISTTVAIHLAALSKEDQKAVLDELDKEEKETGAKKTVERTKKKVAEKQGKAKKTPKERIESATKLLQRFALMTAGEKTKEEMLGTLERITKVLTGQTLEKLAATDEE